MYLENVFEKFFDTGEASLPMDIYREENKLVFEFAVAGYDEEDIDVGIEDGILSVILNKPATNEANRQYYTKRLSKRNRSYKFMIPSQYDQEKVWCSLEKGILVIGFPKKTVAKKILFKPSSPKEE